MTTVSIVGGGPAGLSAALFTAKNGLETTVYDANDTWMHKAHLFNYLGIDSIDGTAFIDQARTQVEGFGASLVETTVTDVAKTEDGFAIDHEDETVESDYLILATGAKRTLAETLGCEQTENGIVVVDVSMETSVENAYATGAMVREEEWQAIISAGDGAAAALNILSKEKGQHFHDFDTPADAE